MRTRHVGIVLVVGLLGGIAGAGAAIITWTGTGTFSSNSVLTTTLPSYDSVLYAADLAGTGATTGNGVTFEDCASGNTAHVQVSGIYQPNIFMGSATTGDVQFNNVLKGAFYQVGSSYKEIPLTLKALTIGTGYNILLLTNDARGGNYDRFFAARSPGGSTSALQQFAWNVPASNPVGGYITGQFIADATTQDLYIGGYYYNNGNQGVGQLNAVVVGVPEPATFSLLALGGLALLRRRRK